MPGGLPPFRVRVGQYDFTYEAENLTFSNVDPGGYEMCSFDLQSGRANIISPGDFIHITDGTVTVWQGRVAEPAKSIKHGWHVNRKVGATTTRVSGEGWGAGLKDNLMSMVYVDRDLTRWQSPSTQRQLALSSGANNQLGSFQVAADPSANPSIAQTIIGAWVSPNRPIVETWYDAGPGNLISTIYYSYAPGTGAQDGGVSWHDQVYLSFDMNASLFQSSGNLNGTGTSGYFTPGVQYRFGILQYYYSTTPAGVDGYTYISFWKNIAVYGNHGLAGRGSDPVGFYTSDIARDAAQRAIQAGANIRIGQVDVLSSYIVPHYAQYTVVPHEQVISDMAKTAPAHYGVWESDSLFDDTPTFTFRAYSSEANYVVGMVDCDEVDISERLANLYTKANVTYQDASGTEYVITVSLPNAILDRVNIKRTQTLDLGLSSSTAASVFANFVLQVLYLQARMAGSATLPKYVRDRKGSPVPSYRLKSGIDRLRITDTPDRTGLLTSSDTDSYRISRVESNVDTSSGQVTTRVTVDAGPDLMETLTSRLNIASLLGGQG